MATPESVSAPQPPGKFGTQGLAAIGAQLFDARDRSHGTPAFLRPQLCRQCAEIDAVLRAIRGERQDFHRHQVAGPGHWHDQAGRDLDALGIPANLGLDTGGSEQQINDDALFTLSGRHDPDGGQPAQRLLLKGHLQRKTGSLKNANQYFGDGIVGDGDHQVDVPRKSRFDANRHREAADQRPGLVPLIENLGGLA